MFIVHPDAAISVVSAMHDERVRDAQRSRATAGQPVTARAGRVLVRAGERLLAQHE